MISYELAKELKEAGFPMTRPWCKWLDVNGREQFKKEPTCPGLPTLSELIEACGERFYSLVKSGRYWKVFSEVEDEYIDLAVGPTPEEAVARLWLALNAKPLPNGDAA